jgi:hypothetical protein
MSTATAKPATPPLPGPLADSECTALLWPHLSRPKRGPQGTRGSQRVVHLRLGLLDTGLPWTGWPVPPAPAGKPVRHATTLYKVLATGAADGSLWQACGASVPPLAVAKPRAISVRPGAGTNTVATTGARAWAPRATHLSRGRKAAPASIIRATSSRRSPWLRSMPQTWSCSPRA